MAALPLPADFNEEKDHATNLRGPTLAVFVFNIKKRIEVLRCFSRKNRAAENLEAFATAAGGAAAKIPAASPAGSPRRTTLVLSSCDQLPEVDWWSKTPTAVRGAVAKNYDGDWDRYIARWRGHYRSMKRSLENNKPQIVRSLGLTLEGKSLEVHVGKIKRRIEVLLCLQKNSETIESRVAQIKSGDTPAVVRADGASAAIPQDGSAEASFETASGGPATRLASGDQMEIDVEARCEVGEATFKLTNLGARWARLGEINIHRTDTKALLVKRRLRMRNSQQLIYKIPANRLGGAQGVGFFVKPSWYDRPFKYDATINCTE